MNLSSFKKNAKLIRSNTTYDISDLQLNNLVLSLTELHGLQSTTGHSHDADEVYIFISGRGKIQINEDFSACKGGDIFVIPRGAFHKVQNPSTGELKFWCVFEKYGER